MKFDICFLYHQFFKELPETFEQFSKSMASEFLGNVYDTKVFSLYDDKMKKSDLQYLYKKCISDKKYSNNVLIESDKLVKK